MIGKSELGLGEKRGFDMDRRSFLQTVTLAGGLSALWPVAAMARYEAVPYRRGLLRELQEEGRLIVVNFTAEWSPLSRLKRDTLAQIKSENPTYSQAITFVDIDWDTFGPSRMVERMRIKEHATLVAFRGSREIARITGTYDEAELRAFLERVIAAG